MTHIDAAIYLVPLPLLAALAWITARDEADRRSLARVIVFGLLGLAPTAILGTWDVWYAPGTITTTSVQGCTRCTSFSQPPPCSPRW